MHLLHYSLYPRQLPQRFRWSHLVAQAKELVANGAKELILVAQETTVYGMDLYGEKVTAGAAAQAVEQIRRT